MTVMPKISRFLWFNDNAEEAMNFYTSVFKNGALLSCVPTASEIPFRL
jgi:predicted 3-demethylubiquinone-9 3-methyltransferase (glyoxalase superfamily)